MKKIFITFAFLTLIFSFCSPCPTDKDLHPCICHSPTYSAYIECPDLKNDDDLMHATSSLTHMDNIYSFSISDAFLYFIPHDAFKGVNFTELEIRQSALMDLSEEELAFEGLEDHLKILLIQNCSFLNEWKWSSLRKLRSLMSLEVTDSDLEFIDAGIGGIEAPELRDITFDNNRITYVHSHAFSAFPLLTFLSLSGNRIFNVLRSMFPDPADMLLNIDLSYNRIHDLPRDMFTNMRNLQSLDLTGNTLVTLDDRTFEPIWKNLNRFIARGNKFECDCLMKWVIFSRGPQMLEAECSSPGDLKGRNFRRIPRMFMDC